MIYIIEVFDIPEVEETSLHKCRKMINVVRKCIFNFIERYFLLVAIYSYHHSDQVNFLQSLVSLRFVV